MAAHLQEFEALSCVTVTRAVLAEKVFLKAVENVNTVISQVLKEWILLMFACSRSCHDPGRQNQR